jgi:hypothetical protein
LILYRNIFLKERAMALDHDQQSQHDEVTRLIQQGHRPEDFEGRMRLAADKLRGNVPLGVDAPNKAVRKAIGGAGSLFIVLKYGFFGLVALGLGLLFVWVGLNGQFDIKVFGIGSGLVAVSVYALLRAWRAWQILKTISRA